MRGAAAKAATLAMWHASAGPTVAGGARALALALILAGEKSGGERAPRSDAEAALGEYSSCRAIFTPEVNRSIFGGASVHGWR